MTLRKRLIQFILFPSMVLVIITSGLIGAAPMNTDSTNLKGTVAFATIVANATPTPTPFQPVPPTPTYIPTSFPTPQLQPQETTEPISSADTIPALPLTVPQEQVNVLLLGSDQRVGEIGFRTDTIILLSLNPKQKIASMVSFPRDLYLYLPGWGYQRINTAMYYGGFSLLAQTLEHHFGIRPTHYMLIGLGAFMETIDSLDGINVQVEKTLSDQRTGHGYYTVPAGNTHMSGATALWYARARYTTNDFDRTRRQQEVIQAVAKRLLSLNALENGDELFDIYKNNVTTNLTWSDIAPLIPMAAQIGDPANVRRYAIGPGQVIPWVTPGGAQVLLPQEAAIKNVLRQAINAP